MKSRKAEITKRYHKIPQVRFAAGRRLTSFGGLISRRESSASSGIMNDEKELRRAIPPHLGRPFLKSHATRLLGSVRIKTAGAPKETLWSWIARRCREPSSRAYCSDMKRAHTPARTAPTGGLIAQADKGTLFLDEIGELPMSVQKSFLRVIQERRYRPVGGNKEIDSDFVLVAATNRDLEAMVCAGEFRDDLLHRLTTIQITLPPLRNHKEDIRALVQQWVAQLCRQYKTPMKGFTPEFFDVLEGYDWPGNVRELDQAIERAVASSGSSPLLFPKDLPLKIRAQMARGSVPPLNGLCDTGYVSKGETSAAFPPLDEVRSRAISDVEHAYLSDIMKFTGGDIAAAIALSGLSRARFYALLKKYSIVSTLRSKLR